MFKVNNKDVRTTPLVDIGYENYMMLYKKCTAKPYSFLMIGTSLAWDNVLRFGKECLERI